MGEKERWRPWLVLRGEEPRRGRIDEKQGERRKKAGEGKEVQRMTTAGMVL